MIGKKLACQKLVVPLTCILKQNALKTFFKVVFLNYLSCGNLAQAAIGEWSFRLENFWVNIKNFLPKTSKSHPLSKLLRPWLEHRRFRGAFGASLIVLLVGLGLFGSPSSARSDFVSASLTSKAAIDETSETEIAVVETPKNIAFSTEKRYQMPVETIGISQGFHRYHHGVDMRAPLGSDIKPIAEGVVTGVYRNSYGYGQSVIIEHADGISSLYAHLMKITVEKGSSVDQNSVIAQIGMTGYTTGPHLHLEIYKNGKVTNPQIYLGY